MNEDKWSIMLQNHDVEFTKRGLHIVLLNNQISEKLFS